MHAVKPKLENWLKVLSEKLKNEIVQVGCLSCHDVIVQWQPSSVTSTVFC